MKSDKLALTEGKILNLMFLISIPVVPVKNWLRATHNQRQKTPKVASVLLFRHILKTKSWLECGSSLLNSRMWPGIDAAEKAKYVLLSSSNKYTNQDHHLCTLPKNDGELKNSKTAACRISRLCIQVPVLVRKLLNLGWLNAERSFYDWKDLKNRENSLINRDLRNQTTCSHFWETAGTKLH